MRLTSKGLHAPIRRSTTDRYSVLEAFIEIPAGPKSLGFT